MGILKGTYVFKIINARYNTIYAEMEPPEKESVWYSTNHQLGTNDLTHCKGSSVSL